MSKVLVTGMSGTGKSSVLRVLAARGHATVDTDADEWSRWVTDDRGEPDWVWREDAMAALLAEHAAGHLFVSGCKTNQGAFYGQFDVVALLHAPLEVLFARLGRRTDNPSGTRPEDRASILEHVRTVEPRLRASASAEIDATLPLEEVADRLEVLARTA